MSEYDEDSSVHNQILEYEVVIDRPVREVWKHWLDMGSWIVTHKVEEISEPPRVLGAVTRCSFKSARARGLPPEHHHFCKIVKFVPERQYVLKAWSERGGSYGHNFVGFDDTRFIDVGGKTRITFNVYTETRPVSDKQGEWSKLDQDREESGENMTTNLENLKRIVEGR